jgi:fatty acid synthase, animal type
MEGISKPFDKNCSGYVRSEACCVLFIQKSNKARRVYATILNSSVNNDGYKTEGATTPSVKMQKELYRKTYEDLKMDPNTVDFLEAHATSTEVGDKSEVTSIDEFFCANREGSLKVGSVKGNMGHSEAASGAVSLVKSILMFENEKIIPNINIDELRDCPGFNENRMEVATEVEEFHGKIIGVNNFGVLGTNSHTIIRRNEKTKINGGFPTDDIPRLLLWSGRTTEAVNSIFDNIISQPIDDEFLALLQFSQIESFPTFYERGFSIFKSNPEDRSTICVDRQVKTLEKSNRPIVFIYSGVGSQWLEMGRDLMKIPLISESISKCHEILLKHDIDLKNILTSNCPDVFKNCINIFVGITSIQIALTDLLHKIGVKSNFFIGHSVGELGCAYADENLTLEETILTAYHRGVAIIEGTKKSGLMAAISMSYEDLKNILPSDIEIACHNSHESCTISGPNVSIEKFVAEMKSKQVLCKIIDSSGVAFHSSLISDCGPLLAEKLNKVIIHPKKRSSKWISTSLIEGQDEFSTINYHVNNMLSTVRFAEALTKVPEDSFFIEIAPHGLLQPILKQSNPSAICESLTKRNVEDGIVNLLQSLGKIYQNGVDMNIREMYPIIEFPVSRGTQMISHLIKWQHDESLTVPMFDPFLRCDKRNLTINLKHQKFSFLRGHQIDGEKIISICIKCVLIIF